jgi:hypothetical protein
VREEEAVETIEVEEVEDNSGIREGRELRKWRMRLKKKTRRKD